jgi:hypothetical protein
MSVIGELRDQVEAARQVRDAADVGLQCLERDRARAFDALALFFRNSKFRQLASIEGGHYRVIETLEESVTRWESEHGRRFRWLTPGSAYCVEGDLLYQPDVACLPPPPVEQIEEAREALAVAEAALDRAVEAVDAEVANPTPPAKVQSGGYVAGRPTTINGHKLHKGDPVPSAALANLPPSKIETLVSARVLVVAP